MSIDLLLVVTIILIFIFIATKMLEIKGSIAIRLFIGFLVILLLWGGSGYLLFPLEHRGSFGDMFGAINSLFTGLAFGGLIYATLHVAE